MKICGLLTGKKGEHCVKLMKTNKSIGVLTVLSLF